MKKYLFIWTYYFYVCHPLAIYVMYLVQFLYLWIFNIDQVDYVQIKVKASPPPPLSSLHSDDLFFLLTVCQDKEFGIAKVIFFLLR